MVSSKVSRTGTEVPDPEGNSGLAGGCGQAGSLAMTALTSARVASRLNRGRAQTLHSCYALRQPGFDAETQWTWWEAARVKITLLDDHRLRVEQAPSPLTIEATTREQSYSPFHMMASGLAMCTYSVLQSWASHANLAADNLVIEVGWEFGENPHRVAAYDVRIDWPNLPQERKEAARRTAKLCAVHGTLTHAPAIALSVVGEDAEA